MHNLFINLASRYNFSWHGQNYPDSKFSISPRWASATWIMGNNYKSLSSRGEDDKPFYGAYPPGYLKRVWEMLDPASSPKILHLFSGSLTSQGACPPKLFPSFVVRVDGSVSNNPDVVSNAEVFSQSLSDYHLSHDIPYNFDYDLILADPPYSIQDAENYGKPLCNKRKVLEQCHNVLAKGGLLFWMDQAIPMYSKDKWLWVGVISIYRSTNHRIRGVMIFQKV